MISTLLAALVASASPQPVLLAQGYDGPRPRGGYDERMQPDDGGPPPPGYGGQPGYGGPRDDQGPPSPAEMARQLKEMGYSSAGVRILQAANAQQDQAMQQRGDAVQRELAAAAMANPVDPARVSRALQASDALNAQMASQRTMETARILGQLSPSDRRIFAGNLLGQGDDQGGPPQGQPGGY